MNFEKLESENGKILMLHFLEMVKLSTKQPDLLHTNKDFYKKYNHYYNELLNRLEK